ncbi:MAG: hypothetical protein L6R19_07535 [Alphaproteobacteria bacterium]|nr:hypothetical protein [Alphaproteobacteria bacterium]
MQVKRELLPARNVVGNFKALYAEFETVGAAFLPRMKRRPRGASFILRDPTAT